jgi:hypothetical protein
VRGELQRVAAAAEEMGETVPEVEDSYVYDFNMPYWNGFHTLSRSRGQSGGVTSLPLPLVYTEIAEYCRDHFLASTPDHLDESVEIFQAMDRVYLDFQQKLAQERAKNTRKR